eukprot:5385497-Alexandrium_andersonii.AAC.1
MASSYWCVRCRVLPRHCRRPGVAASEEAGGQRGAGAGGGRQATLGRWLRGQSAQPAPPAA